MFIKFTGNLKKPKFLNVPWKGEVVDNIDPDKLGRIKIKVAGLIEGENKDDLPWAYPLNPYGLGGKPNSSGFSVPEIGTFLQINFPYLDIYFPFYDGYWQDKTTHQPVFDEDYPESFGFIASDGFEFFHNKKTKATRFKLPGDFEITQTGTYTITSTGDLILKADGGVSIEAKKDVSIKAEEKFTVTAKGDISITTDGKATFKGKGGTTVGDPGSVTAVDGSIVNIAGGGSPFALVGVSSVLGMGNHGAPVSSQILSGSTKVFGS